MYYSGEDGVEVLSAPVCGIEFTEVMDMASQQVAAVCDKEQRVWSPVRVRRKFSAPRKSLDMVRNLLRAHQATA